MRNETKSLIAIQKKISLLKSEIGGLIDKYQNKDQITTENEVQEESVEIPSFYFFLSYARADDHDGRISRFRETLEKELHVATGELYQVFQDTKHIGWGEDWRQKLHKEISIVPFLMPFLSPSFFSSEICREELSLFLEIEKSRDRDDLVLPIYFVTIRNFLTSTDKLIQEVRNHNYIDLREIRRFSEDSTEYNNRIIELAESASVAISRVE